MAPSPRVPPEGLGTSLATGGCRKSSTAAVHRNETAASPTHGYALRNVQCAAQFYYFYFYS